MEGKQAGLKELPKEILLIILNKLASQDTLSLLRASWVCKALYVAAEEIPGVWKKQFYAPLGTKQELREEFYVNGNPYGEQKNKLDALIEAIGGFKRLLGA